MGCPGGLSKNQKADAPVAIMQQGSKTKTHLRYACCTLQLFSVHVPDCTRWTLSDFSWEACVGLTDSGSSNAVAQKAATFPIAK